MVCDISNSEQVTSLFADVELRYGRVDILVNATCPGPTNTELLSGLTPEQLQSLTRRIPLTRMAEPGDIASAALFLASDESSFVTGQTLSVNGGSWFS